eukprot:evm.model.scf_99.7 EVM.evm.TU.scf_99.7   scf_99:89342-90491(-)
MTRWSHAADAIRNSNINVAAADAVDAAVKHCGHSCREDTTALVLDVVAPREDPLVGEANTSGPLRAGVSGCCCRALAACLCGYSDSATLENWRMDRDKLLVVSRVDGLDLAKAAIKQGDSRFSRLAARCLPQGAAKAPPAPTHNEWAPAFLTAQRAKLGGSSSGGAWAPVQAPPPRPSMSRRISISSCFTGDSH